MSGFGARRRGARGRGGAARAGAAGGGGKGFGAGKRSPPGGGEGKGFEERLGKLAQNTPKRVVPFGTDPAEVGVEERLAMQEERSKGLSGEGGVGKYASVAEAEAAPYPDVDDREMPGDDIPPEIADRMFKRMLGFAAGPALLGLLFFPAFYYLKVVQDVDVPTWVVYVVTGLFFGGSLLGISYGALSTSPILSRPGSLLGFEEFKNNFPAAMGKFGKK